MAKVQWFLNRELTGKDPPLNCPFDPWRNRHVYIPSFSEYVDPSCPEQCKRYYEIFQRTHGSIVSVMREYERVKTESSTN